MIAARACFSLANRPAHELALAGWELQIVTADSGSEFVNRDFGN
jgi:hypothetical protein